MKILAIPGSLRAGSINHSLLDTAKRLAPQDVEVAIFKGIGEIPLFNPDDDNDPSPFAVGAFRAAIAAADAILISSPEYARGVPGALKNALDWLVSDHRVAGKTVAMINAASGGGKDVTEQLALILTTMAAKVIFAASLVGAHVRQNDPIVEKTVQESLDTMIAASRRPHE